MSCLACGETCTETWSSSKMENQSWCLSLGCQFGSYICRIAFISLPEAWISKQKPSCVLCDLLPRLRPFETGLDGRWTPGMSDCWFAQCAWTSCSSLSSLQVIQWCTHHKDDPPPPEDDENKEKRTDDIPVWDQEFLKVDQGTLFELILVCAYHPPCHSLTETVWHLHTYKVEVSQVVNLGNGLAEHTAPVKRVGA